ncbi:hypothetical protein [Halanaerobium kushneri]|uniref:hypothetical protein n=1 Tax=Halanaerobium kushneri TaxID=56779 RepID=UPI00135669F9|nr:hypothetical protein [Halanaerobium kushneri]
MLINDFELDKNEAEDLLWQLMPDIKNDFSSMPMLQDFADRYEFKMRLRPRSL